MPYKCAFKVSMQDQRKFSCLPTDAFVVCSAGHWYCWMGSSWRILLDGSSEPDRTELELHGLRQVMLAVVAPSGGGAGCCWASALSASSSVESSLVLSYSRLSHPPGVLLIATFLKCEKSRVMQWRPQRTVIMLPFWFITESSRGSYSVALSCRPTFSFGILLADPQWPGLMA